MQENSKKGLSKFNLKNNNFVIRFLSSIVLVSLIVIYLSIAVLSQELWVNLQNKNQARITSYTLSFIMILIACVILSFCVYELAKAFKINNRWYIFAITVLSISMFLAPIGPMSTLENLFLYSYSWIRDSLFVKVYMQFIYFVLFILIFFIVSHMFRIDFTTTFIILAISLLIIFGLKGFSNVTLNNDYQNNGYDDISFGYITTIWIWLIIILNDSFAYIFGSKFGKHKMAPKISPNKSWEGAIGGLVTAVLISLSIAIVLFTCTPGVDHSVFKEILSDSSIGIAIVIYLLFAFLISVMGQLGDLFFSAIKRKIGIKDFSNLIPGHGGMLDRLDSFIVVFALMFLFTVLY